MYVIVQPMFSTSGHS